MCDPLASVVLPFYNSESYLADAIESVLAQEYSNFELILVDDGSQDASHQIAASYQSANVRLVRQDNHGVAHAFARGVALADGPIIVSFAADDISHKDRIARSVRRLGEGHHQIVGCRPNIIDDSGTDVGVAHFSGFERSVDANDSNKLLSELFYGYNFICAPATTIEKDVLLSLGVHHGLMQLQDFDLWLRAAAAGVRFHIEETAWLDYRWHDANTSAAKNQSRSFRELTYVYRNLNSLLNADNLHYLLTERPPSFVDLEKALGAPAPVMSPLVYIMHHNPDIRQVGYEMLIDILNDAEGTKLFEKHTGMLPSDLFELLRI